MLHFTSNGNIKQIHYYITLTGNTMPEVEPMVNMITKGGQILHLSQKTYVVSISQNQAR